MRQRFAFELHILKAIFFYVSFLLLLLFIVAASLFAVGAVVVCEIVGHLGFTDNRVATEE